MDYLKFLLEHLTHVSISATLLAAVTLVGAEDAPLFERARIALQAVDDFSNQVEQRRLSGVLLDTLLAQSIDSQEVTDTKKAFDDAFKIQQADRFVVFRRAALFAFGPDTPAYKRFDALYDVKLSKCMLKPWRENLLARYRCLKNPSVCSSNKDVIALPPECGRTSISSKDMNNRVTLCTQTLTSTLDRAVEAKSAYLGIFGRISAAWLSMNGGDTLDLPGKRSWRAAMNHAESTNCRLGPQATAEAPAPVELTTLSFRGELTE
jgi:hypothetical protein